MCVKEWKRIAEWEAVHYRERKAFLRGMEDAGCAMTERAAQYKRWVDAVERVLVYLERYAPEKGLFFRQCYGIDGDRKLYDKKGMLRLTFVFHASQSTLYQWRDEVLSLLLIAAAENGALQPFCNN